MLTIDVIFVTSVDHNPVFHIILPK